MAIVTNVGAFVRGDGLDIYRITCPICRQKLHAQALVTHFNEPPEWIFYGQQGRRVKRCEGWLMGHWFTHFVVKLDSGAISHRMAWERDGDEN